MLDAMCVVVWQASNFQANLHTEQTQPALLQF